ncbi:MAG: hypothetical protein JW754_02740 [Candidatus Aenigmarchaeota archaeon]|nr:hypothetical protein [Candidatus Aenigmarchaeota archaeon]
MRVNLLSGFCCYFWRGISSHQTFFSLPVITSVFHSGVFSGGLISHVPPYPQAGIDLSPVPVPEGADRAQEFVELVSACKTADRSGERERVKKSLRIEPLWTIVYVIGNEYPVSLSGAEIKMLSFKSGT